MLFGDAGNDVLIGGTGGDTLEGGEGADRLNGKAGVDSLAGGPGDDQYFWDAGTGADTFIEDAAAGDRDQITIGGGKRQLSSKTRVPRYVEADDRIAVGMIEESGIRKVRLDAAAVDGGSETIILDNIEVLSVVPGGGADTVTLNDLAGTDVTTLGVNLGQGDRGETDVVVFNGSDADDTITAEGEVQIIGTVDNEVVYDEVVEVSDTTKGSERVAYIQDSDPARDRLTVAGLAGNDALTASGSRTSSR
jgi:hypothetical protein